MSAVLRKAACVALSRFMCAPAGTTPAGGRTAASWQVCLRCGGCCSSMHMQHTQEWGARAAAPAAPHVSFQPMWGL